MKDKSVCFIGQKDVCENPSETRRAFAKILFKLILDGYKFFYVDDRLGFDELFFDTIVILKKLYTDCPSFRIILYEDTKGTTVKRDMEQNQIFRELANKADRHQSFFGTTRTKRATRKHIDMIESCSVCVTYLDSSADEETLRALDFAKQQNLKIINIYETLNKNELVFEPCKYEIYYYEYDFFDEEEKIIPKWDKSQREMFDEFGLTKISKDRSFTPKKIIEKDKRTFFRLKDKLSLYARQHKGSIRAVVNTEKWEARIDISW